MQASEDGAHDSGGLPSYTLVLDYQAAVYAPAVFNSSEIGNLNAHTFKLF
jgi:hypothetical protein